MIIENDDRDERLVALLARVTHLLEECAAVASDVKAIVETVPTVDDETWFGSGGVYL